MYKPLTSLKIKRLKTSTSPEYCLAAVLQNVDAFQYIPKQLKTEPICLAAVTKNGTLLKQIPKHLRTESVCLAAVNNNGWALQWVPVPLRTESICLAAVLQDGKALYNVPEHLIPKFLLTLPIETIDKGAVWNFNTNLITLDTAPFLVNSKSPKIQKRLRELFNNQ